VFHPIRLLAAVMLTVLMVLPTTVGLAQNFFSQKSANQHRSSNFGNLSRAANVQNSSRTLSSSKRLSTSPRNLSNANRFLRKVQPTPTRRVPTVKLSRVPSATQSTFGPYKRPSKSPPFNILPSIKPDLRTPNRPGVVGNLTPSIKPDLLRPNRLGQNGKLRGITKLAGIQNFERLVSQVGKTDLKPLELEKFDGKFSDVLKGANLKLNNPEVQQAKNFAIQNLSLHSHCHWWIDFVIGGHWHWNHCDWWDHCYTPGYWHCWTPCHYQVVYCPPVEGYISSSWYFGVDCILIPDMAAYGIQEVKPNSPAAFAGLIPGDLIVSINGQGIEDELVLPYAIQTSGGHLELGVIREGSDEPVLVYVALQLIERLSY